MPASLEQNSVIHSLNDDGGSSLIDEPPSVTVWLAEQGVHIQTRRQDDRVDRVNDAV